LVEQGFLENFQGYTPTQRVEVALGYLENYYMKGASS